MYLSAEPTENSRVCTPYHIIANTTGETCTTRIHLAEMEALLASFISLSIMLNMGTQVLILLVIRIHAASLIDLFIAKQTVS